MPDMERLPDWAERLNAVTDDTSPVAWHQWSAEVITYRTSFDALQPPLSGKERQQPERWQEEAGKVMLRPKDGSARSFVEAEVVKSFRAVGWKARWTDAFGAARPWMETWTREQRGRFPQSLSTTLRGIERASSKGEPWDVLAWLDGKLAFVECKAPHEGFTDAESAYIWGAVKSGVSIDRFAVLQADIRYPEAE